MRRFKHKALVFGELFDFAPRELESKNHAMYVHSISVGITSWPLFITCVENVTEVMYIVLKKDHKAKGRVFVIMVSRMREGRLMLTWC